MIKIPFTIDEKFDVLLKLIGMGQYELYIAHAQMTELTAKNQSLLDDNFLANKDAQQLRSKIEQILKTATTETLQ